MPNIAQALKQEISRIARKEVRAETLPLRAVTTKYRQQIATLKKEVAALQRELRRSGNRSGTVPAAPQQEDSDKQLRFSPTRLAAQRKKLGLSAREFGQLIGVSALSVYKWEQGKTRPRAKQLEAIASIRGIGKREAAARLEAFPS